MKKQTRSILLKIIAAIAVAVTAAAVFVPAAALAAAMTTTGNANVRATPGGPVIGTLRRGTTVEVIGCGGGWCRLDGGGFVSSSLLRRAGGGVGIGITIGPGGAGISIGTGQPPVIVDDDDDYFGEVCFYSRTNYRGSSFCMEEGDSIRRLGPDWNDEISSFRNPDGLRVTVCMDRSYDGCRTYTSSARSLGAFDDEISSIRVR